MAAPETRFSVLVISWIGNKGKGGELFRELEKEECIGVSFGERVVAAIGSRWWLRD